MHKILITGNIGTLEWTPPPSIQQKFDAVDPEIAGWMKDWMAHMLEGYAIALLSVQASPEKVQWFDELTKVLVESAISIHKPTSPPSPRTMH